jgi:hypothetical protein
MTMGNSRKLAVFSPARFGNLTIVSHLETVIRRVFLRNMPKVCPACHTQSVTLKYPKEYQTNECHASFHAPCAVSEYLGTCRLRRACSRKRPCSFGRITRHQKLRRRCESTNRVRQCDAEHHLADCRDQPVHHRCTRRAIVDVFHR